MDDLQKKSILRMARGAIEETTDYEMAIIMDNILDPNTNPTKKRTLTLTVEFVPDSQRKTINVRASAKSKLEPTNPVATSLYIAPDENGEVEFFEMAPQIPGQRSFDGDEQEETPVLKIIKNA